MAAQPKPGAPAPRPPLKLIQGGLSEEVILAEDTDVAAEIATGADISIPILFGVAVLMAILYTSKYLLIPLMKLIKVPGSGWLSEAVNAVLGFITSPIKDFLQWMKHTLATGIESMAAPFTKWLNMAAHEIHDFAIETANAFETVLDELNRLVNQVIPAEIARAIKPLTSRLNTLAEWVRHIESTAIRAGFKNFLQWFAFAAPLARPLYAAIKYVESQGHVSLAGALSAFQTVYKDWLHVNRAMNALGFLSIPTFASWVKNMIEGAIIPKIERLTTRVNKIAHELTLNNVGIPIIMSLMSAEAIAKWLSPAIDKFCEPVGDCAASKLVGSGPWNAFKSLLKLLLAAEVDALLLADLCAIGKAMQEIAGAIEPELRQLVTVEGGLIGEGCANQAQVLPPPLY